MNVSKLLQVLALLCAVILLLLGFDVFHADDPHLFGWVGATLALSIGSLLVP